MLELLMDAGRWKGVNSSVMHNLRVPSQQLGRVLTHN